MIKEIEESNNFGEINDSAIRINCIMPISSGFRTAVLYQASPPLAINGVIKPAKPGGYRDSAADIAYNLQAAGEDIILPVDNPDPKNDSDWSFPDTRQGILDAVAKGANVLWVNSTLHSQHPLVHLARELPGGTRYVGQNPFDVERYEDKAWLNRSLDREALQGKFPKSWEVRKGDVDTLENDVELLAVLKPVRGRGSHGVTLARTCKELVEKAKQLWEEQDVILVESYCGDEEVTITVMPPGLYTDVGFKHSHWALPVITRFDHVDGIAPYNGVVPVTANSRAVSAERHREDSHYTDVQAWAAMVGSSLQTLAPIRIDARRQVPGGPFYMFDINMKPNATGPGRPGRDDQASLVLMAAEAIGWDVQKLLRNVLVQAQPVAEITSRMSTS